MTISDEDMAAMLMTLAEERAPDRTFCPSEAARRLDDDWRPLMAALRRIAADLPLVATQKGATVDPRTARGPIRLARAPQSRRGSRG